MGFVEYCFDNWKNILVTSILIQVGLAILKLMKNFNQETAEKLFMIYLGIGLPVWASVFFTGLFEILLFLLIGYAYYYFDD